MSIKKIKEYIKKARKRKVNDQEIKEELKNIGWDEKQIEKAFEKIETKEKKSNSSKKRLKLSKNKVS